MKHYIKNIGVGTLSYANNIGPGGQYEFYDSDTKSYGINFDLFINSMQDDNGIGKDIYDGNIEYYIDTTISSIENLRSFLLYIKSISVIQYISGPTSAVENTILKFKGNSGKEIETTNIIVDASNNITFPGDLEITGIVNSGTWEGNVINDAYITKTGNWTGSFDGQDGTYYLDRLNHTGTQTAITISDFDTEVSNNIDVAANTANRHFHTNKYILDLLSVVGSPGKLEYNGSIIESLYGLDIFDEIALSFSGMSFNPPSFSIVNDGGLKLDISNIDSGDMRFIINGEITTLDCTTGSGISGAARVSLIEGTSAVPTTNYIYVTNNNGTATLNTSVSMPTGNFGWIGKLIIPDATTWTTTGEYLIQRYTESFLNNGRGLLSHEREKLRALGAVYTSGGSHILNITSNPVDIDSVHLEVAATSVYQLHRQMFPSFLTGPYYIGNDVSGGTLTNFQQLNDLNEILEIADGTPFANNRIYNLVIWGAVNYSAGDCKLFVNIPSGTYGNSSNAIADTLNYADFSVPTEFRSVAFLISHVILLYSTSSNGTISIVGDGAYSLLGQSPNVRGTGSGAIISTEFSDDSFRINDNIDNTKQIAFQASNISTGTVRTITMIDSNTTLLSQSQVTDLTDSGDSTLHYHSSDRNRANHTGTQTAITISDFDTEVSNNIDVAANTTHRGLIIGNPHNVTKADVGLTNVTNDAQLTIANNLSDLNSKQIALNNITVVTEATNEYVLTKDTVSGDAIWKQTQNDCTVDSFSFASAGSNISIPNGTSLEWSGFSSTFIMHTDVTITTASTLSFYLQSGGGNCIISIYEYDDILGTHDLIADTAVVTTAGTGIQIFTINNIISANMIHGKIYMFVLLHEWAGSITIGHTLEATQAKTPRRNQSFVNLGDIGTNGAPSSLVVATETTNGTPWFSLSI